MHLENKQRIFPSSCNPHSQSTRTSGSRNGNRPSTSTLPGRGDPTPSQADGYMALFRRDATNTSETVSVPHARLSFSTGRRQAKTQTKPTKIGVRRVAFFINLRMWQMSFRSAVATSEKLQRAHRTRYAVVFQVLCSSLDPELSNQEKERRRREEHIAASHVSFALTIL